MFNVKFNYLSKSYMIFKGEVFVLATYDKVKAQTYLNYGRS